MVPPPVHRAGQRTSGAWGNHTSTIDWCEDKYVHTNYIAETYNTLSNIPFILLGLHGYFSSLALTSTTSTSSHPQPHPNRYRYALAHMGIALIGMGSSAFHGTLKWHAQVLLDELPMIWVSSWVLYVVWVTEANKERMPGIASESRVGHVNYGLLAAVAAIPIMITVAYITNANPIFHQIAFATIMVLLYVRLLSLLRTVPSTSSVRDESYNVMITGLGIFILGFAVWNVDNYFCEGLTQWRKIVGEVFGWISQGHAWWHLLTGLGSSRMVVGINYLCLSIEEPESFELVYSYGGLLPYIRQRPSTPIADVVEIGKGHSLQSSFEDFEDAKEVLG